MDNEVTNKFGLSCVCIAKGGDVSQHNLKRVEYGSNLVEDIVPNTCDGMIVDGARHSHNLERPVCRPGRACLIHANHVAPIKVSKSVGVVICQSNHLLCTHIVLLDGRDERIGGVGEGNGRIIGRFPDSQACF